MQTTKAQATAQRIADAAAVLFADNGFDDTTIGAVAEAAGVASGTVMLHFGSKSQLATAAFADQIRSVVDDARQLPSKGSLESDLAQFVRPIYGWYDTNRSFAPDLLREALFSSGPWAHHYEQTVANTVSALADIIERHHSTAEVQAAAEGLLAGYLLVLLQSFRSPVPVSDQVTHFLRLASARF